MCVSNVAICPGYGKRRTAGTKVQPAVRWGMRHIAVCSTVCFQLSTRSMRQIGQGPVPARLAAFLVAVLLNELPALAERLALASFMVWEFWAAFQLIVRPTALEFAASR